MTKKEKSIKKNECCQENFWTIYKIINFHRVSMKGVCPKCKSKIKLKYLGHDAMKGDFWVRSFSVVLWMSPAFLILFLASVFAASLGPWIYLLAILLVTVFHFWAMYYIIKGGLVKVITK